MMFLMSAKRMSKGMARLRHFLILLMRVLAVAALIFVVSRPLSGGWLGSIGMSKPDATLILLDPFRQHGSSRLTSGSVEKIRSTS